jgi:glycosyltransferase involved in cell wall biosynthesis
VGYGADIIEALERKPVIKRIYDMWPHGNEVLRRWLLDCAQLLIPVSPIQTERASWNAQAPTLCVPCAVEVEQYRVAADAAGNDRYGHVWIGRLFPGKGVGAVQRWADKNRTVVDVYGFGPDLDILEEPCRYGGELEPDAVADTLARYETFVFLPTETDPCPRSVIEAWSAGCELVVNNNVGTLYWIQHEPQALENASVLFWDAVKEVIK